jgi:hypothetical protein
MSAERIQELEAKLAARRNKPGMAENVREIEAELARLKAEQPSGD